MRLKHVALCFAVLAIAAVVAGGAGAQSVATTVQAFNITSGVPTAGPTVPPSSGANTCAVVLNAPPVNTTLTPQGSDNGLSWVPLPGIGGGSITKAGVYVGPNPHLYFRVYFASTTSPGVTGYEACGASALAILTPLLQGQSGSGVASVGVTTPITKTGPSSAPLIGCLGVPLACGTVIQGPAYGMIPDSGTTDNGPPLQAAVNAACALGGGIIEVPYYGSGNVYGFKTAVNVPCSNIQLYGYGQGAGLGSPHYPNPIAPGTNFKCYGSLSGAPLLSFNPTTAQIQAANSVFGIGFDGNSNGSSADMCSTGLYMTGQQQPVLDRLSFKHFTGPALHLQGAQLGGSAKGSVIFPRLGSIEISQPSAWDGPCMTLDSLSVAGVDWGDVFGGDGAGAIHCIGWNWPRIIIGRSDHLNLPPIQVNQPAGAPTPTPNPSGSPPPTPFPDIAIVCGAKNDHFSGVVMAQIAQYRAESNTPTSPEPPPPSPSPCASPEKDPGGTTFDALQTYANSALPPGWTVGALVFNDDYGDVFLPAIANDSHLPFLCFSQPSQTGGQSGCTGVEILGDTLGNVSIGVNGTNQTDNVLFAPGGNGNSQLPTSYQSFINPNGCLTFRTIATPGAMYCANQAISSNVAQIISPATSGDTTEFINTGASGGACAWDFYSGPVPSPSPSPSAQVACVSGAGAAYFNGGVQPNGSTGGYAAEVYPLGVITVHPRTVTGNCASVAVAGTVCTFPNSFAFAGNGFTCTIAAEGSTPHYFSYDTKITTGFTAYSDAGTPTIDYSCTR